MHLNGSVFVTTQRKHFSEGCILPMWPHGRTIVSNEYVLIFVQLFLSATEMRDYALPASAFHLTYWTHLQCTEGTVSDEPGTQGLREHARKRASSTIMQRGGYSCTFFCWFKHKKHMSKSSGAECPHHRVSISWHFGVSVCGAWATVWPGSRSRERKCPGATFQGGIWAAPATALEKSCWF